MMPEKNCGTSATLGGFREKLIARRASRRFQRLPGLAGKGGYIHLAKLETAIKLPGQAFDEFRVGSTRTSPQLMIEMADKESTVAKLGELMQERDRVAPAGNANEVRLVLWKQL
jgi:hypothetical protein